jgi:hypothetical protein
MKTIFKSLSILYLIFGLGITVSLARQEEWDNNPVYQSLYIEVQDEIDIMKTYDPKKSKGPNHEWIMRAVSKKVREKWAADFFDDAPKSKARYYKGLDELSLLCSKKLSLRLPPEDFLAYRDVNDEALITKNLGDLSKLKVHKIGFQSAISGIYKNDLGVPLNKWKFGYVYLRDNNDDHPYCKVYKYNMVQEYEGGGKYGKTYPSFEDVWLVGCPTK